MLWMKINTLSRNGRAIPLKQSVCYSWCDPSSSARFVSTQRFFDPANVAKVLCLLALCMPPRLQTCFSFLSISLNVTDIARLSFWFLPPNAAIAVNNSRHVDISCLGTHTKMCSVIYLFYLRTA